MIIFSFWFTFCFLCRINLQWKKIFIFIFPLLKTSLMRGDCFILALHKLARSISQWVLCRRWLLFQFSWFVILANWTAPNLTLSRPIFGNKFLLSYGRVGKVGLLHLTLYTQILKLRRSVCVTGGKVLSGPARQHKEDVLVNVIQESLSVWATRLAYYDVTKTVQPFL